MKNMLILTLCALFVVGCKKDKPTPPSANMVLLTARTWQFDEYYIQYGTPTQSLEYTRGAPDNKINIDAYTILFKRDGTVEAITNEGSSRGTWKFLNGERQVEMTVTYPTTGTSTALLTVKTMTDQQFYWHNEPYGVYARMSLQP